MLELHVETFVGVVFGLSLLPFFLFVVLRGPVNKWRADARAEKAAAAERHMQSELAKHRKEVFYTAMAAIAAGKRSHFENWHYAAPWRLSAANGRQDAIACARAIANRAEAILSKAEDDL